MDYEIPAFDIFELKPRSKKYCVGIPVINEGRKIRTQLQLMNEFGIGDVADVILFDGGSTDGSTEIDFLTSNNVRSLLVKKGKARQGAQFRMGFNYILEQGYNGIVTIDGNGKDSFENIPDFIKELENGVDFIQGSRFIKGGRHKHTPAIRKFAIQYIHAPWISSLAGFKYTDTTTAYRGISRKFLLDEQLNIFRNIFVGYELLYYMSVKAPVLGYNTKEIPITRSYPKGKTPTKISYRDNFNIIASLAKLTLNYYS